MSNRLRWFVAAFAFRAGLKVLPIEGRDAIADSLEELFTDARTHFELRHAATTIADHIADHPLPKSSIMWFPETRC